jgi:hypothetical protein
MLRQDALRSGSTSLTSALVSLGIESDTNLSYAASLSWSVALRCRSRLISCSMSSRYLTAQSCQVTYIHPISTSIRIAAKKETPRARHPASPHRYVVFTQYVYPMSTYACWKRNHKGTEQLRRRLALVRSQFFTALLDTLDAPHQQLQLVTGLPELDRGASRVQRLSLLDLRE